MLKNINILWRKGRPNQETMKDVDKFLSESPGKALFILLFVIFTFSISLFLVFS